MKYLIYNRERQYEIYSLSIYYSLRQLGYSVNLTTNIDISINSVTYIIIGGEFITDIPKYYYIIQTLPTSHLTLSDKIDAYWMSEEYLDLLKNAIEIWDIYRKY